MLRQEFLEKWQEDAPIDAEEEYTALVQALTWQRGFSIQFVQALPLEATHLIQRIQAYFAPEFQVAQKAIDVLTLEAPIDNLYNIVADRYAKKNIDILFIVGLEISLKDYIKPGFGGEGEYYNLDTIPPILSHLNLQRERFRDLPITLVFLLPLYALKYFARRAPDFFDWRSGTFTIPPDQNLLTQEVTTIDLPADFSRFDRWTDRERIDRITKIEELLTKPLATDDKQKLLLQQGNILYASKRYEEAIANYNQVLQINDRDENAYLYRGLAKYALEDLEGAIADWQQVRRISPRNTQAFAYLKTAKLQLRRGR